MANEFELSLLNHAITSGRDANCFFQSFFHTLTNQPQAKLDGIKKNYSNAIKAFVDTFNSELALKTPIDFDEIIAISRALHPLERECVFGPILRETYNTMITRKIISGDKLIHHPKAILYSYQTGIFANAFGAEYHVYLNEQQFLMAKSGGMSHDEQLRIGKTGFKINNQIFYHDYVDQKLERGKQFELNIVWADTHINFTLGSLSLNREHNLRVKAQVTPNGGIFVTGPAPYPAAKAAPLAQQGKKYPEIIMELCQRFNLENDLKINDKSSTTINQNIIHSKKELKTFPLISNSEIKFFDDKTKKYSENMKPETNRNQKTFKKFNT